MGKHSATIINLWGAPGTGKSTTAAGLFNLMKVAGIKCELLQEYAKRIVWWDRHKELNDQLFITGCQNHGLEMLVDKVDFIITDSPLMLGMIYEPPNYYTGFTDMVKQVFDSYNNINFLLNRVKPYNPDGRTQTEDESILVAKEIEDLMMKYNINHIHMDATPNVHHQIFIEVFGDDFDIPYVYTPKTIKCKVN